MNNIHFKRNFPREAESLIRLLPNTFTSHDFYTLFAMGFPLSYLDWMETYKDVQKAHNQISHELRRLSDKGTLNIKHIGDVSDPSIFGIPDKIAQWVKL